MHIKMPMKKFQIVFVGAILLEEFRLKVVFSPKLFCFLVLIKLPLLEYLIES